MNRLGYCAQPILTRNIMKKILLLLFLGVLVFASCKKNPDEDDVVIITKILNEQSYYNTGDIVTFHVKSFANKGDIHKINISSVSVGMETLLDSVINAERADFHFFYHVPSFNDTIQQVKFIFKSICSTGNESQMNKQIKVRSYDAPLEELGQFTMYSALSGKPDGFSINLVQTVYSQIDTTRCDFYDCSADASGVFGRQWNGKNDLLFARFNDFNYSQATRKSVTNAFNDANKTTFIGDINNDDIIFIGNENRAFGVIKVMAVYDEPGTEDDRYNFYLKKINW